VVLATLVAVVAVKRGLRFPRPRWLPAAAAALPPVVLAGAVVRVIIAAPHITTRDYAGHSLEWISWWIGKPIIAAATIGAALLAYRVLSSRQPEWTLPLMVFGWTITVFLARPAITPDMPWASRRLVPAVLPGCILLAAWAASWVTRRLKERGFAGLRSTLFAACCAILLIALPARIAFKPLLGSAGISLRGLAVQDTYRGELAAVDKLCGAIPAGSTVVFVDSQVADRLLENVRGECGVPAARLRDVSVPKIRQVISGIEGTGRRAVLLGSTKQEFNEYSDGTVKQVMNLHAQIDGYDMNGVPGSTLYYSVVVWMWEQSR
jgi:hypothetical protein